MRVPLLPLWISLLVSLCFGSGTANAAAFDVRDPSGPVEAGRLGHVHQRMLADFEPVDGELLAWDDDLADALVGITRAVAETATPFLLVGDEDERLFAETYLEGSELDPDRVRFVEVGYDSAWTRDYGPVPVVQPGGEVIFVDSRYSDDRPLDERIPHELGNRLEVPVVMSDIELSGGNFITNGAGLCLATDLIEEENPEWDEHELAFHLWSLFGCTSIAILERLAGEETGHVDMFAAFTAPDTLLVGAYDAEVDPRNAEVLDRNAEFLADIALPGGRRLNVIRIPMPSNHDQIFRSYTNSLVVNGTVLMPVYTDAREQEGAALEAYARALPEGSRILTLDADRAIALGGALHCLARAFSHGPTRAETMLRVLKDDIEAASKLFERR